MADTKQELRRCSFCGRTEEEVALLIPGQKPETYICDNCIDICSDFLNHHVSTVGESEEGKLTFDTLPKPKEIKAMLDEYVIGQDDAKLALSVAEGKILTHFGRNGVFILSYPTVGGGDAEGLCGPAVTHIVELEGSL